MIVGNRLHEHDFRIDIFCNLLDLEFPEMSRLDLEFPAGYGNDAVLGRFDALPDFLALTHINLHGFSSMPILYLQHMNLMCQISISSGIPTGLHGLIPFHGDRQIGW